MPIQDKKKNLITMENSFNSPKLAKSYNRLICKYQLHTRNRIGGKDPIIKRWKAIMKLYKGVRAMQVKSMPQERQGSCKKDLQERHMQVREISSHEEEKPPSS